MATRRGTCQLLHTGSKLINPARGRRRRSLSSGFDLKSAGMWVPSAQSSAGPPDRTDYRYCVYGVAVSSDRPLALPQHGCGDLGAVDLTSADAAELSALVQGAEFHPG